MNTTIAAVLRWVARVTSLASGVGLLLFLVGEGFRPADIDARDWIGLVFFPFGVLIGLTIAWWYEAVGALIVIGSLAAFYLAYGALISARVPSGPWFAIFAAPAVLFLVSWFLLRRVR